MKYFPQLFQFFFRITIPIDSQLNNKCSYISSKFFPELFFGTLKIGEITKIIIAAINFRGDTHLKASDKYFEKVFELYGNLCLCFLPNFSTEEKEK